MNAIPDRETNPPEYFNDEDLRPHFNDLDFEVRKDIVCDFIIAYPMFSFWYEEALSQMNTGCSVSDFLLEIAKYIYTKDKNQEWIL